MKNYKWVYNKFSNTNTIPSFVSLFMMSMMSMPYLFYEHLE